ncbi:MAG: hypothetical protein EBY13_01660 [Actinobacteria bacterium]|nr:hypothetical protein [Actinomycetota bacterium]NDH12593.1 hypothetical protein [Actinomycetota bacterium]
MKKSSQIKRAVAPLIKSERGNVESFLVMIPLIILFLIVFQLVVALYQRNIATFEVQKIANRIAINGGLNNPISTQQIRNDFERSLHNSDANIEVANLELPGGGVLVSVNKYVEIPIFTALFRNTKFGEFFRVRSLVYSEIN